MFKVKRAWLICSTFHNEDKVEFTISQECYMHFEDAQAFCENRHNGQVYDLDKYTYVSEPDSRGAYYEYKIIEVHLK